MVRNEHLRITNSSDFFLSIWKSLFYSAGDEARVESLIANGANVSSMNSYGSMPLDSAIYNGNVCIYENIMH